MSIPPELYLKELIMIQKIHRELVSGQNPVNLVELYNGFGTESRVCSSTSNGTQIVQQQHQQTQIGTNLAHYNEQSQNSQVQHNRLNNLHHMTAAVPALLNAPNLKNIPIATTNYAKSIDQNAKMIRSNYTAQYDQNCKKGVQNLNKTADDNAQENCGEDDDPLIDVETIELLEDEPGPSNIFVQQQQCQGQPNWEGRQRHDDLNAMIDSESVGTSASFGYQESGRSDDHDKEKESTKVLIRNEGLFHDKKIETESAKNEIIGEKVIGNGAFCQNLKKNEQIKAEQMENDEKEVENEKCDEQNCSIPFIKEEISEFDQIIENEGNIAKEIEKESAKNEIIGKKDENGKKTFGKNKTKNAENGRKCDWSKCDLEFENDNALYDHIKADHIDELIEKCKASSTNGTTSSSCTAATNDETFACKWKNCDLPARRGNAQRKFDWLLNHIYVRHLPRAETHICLFFGCEMRFRKLTALNNHLHAVHAEGLTSSKKRGRKRQRNLDEFDETI